MERVAAVQQRRADPLLLIRNDRCMDNVIARRAEHVRHARPARVNRRTGAAAVAHGEHRRRIAAHYSLNQQRTYAARPGMISLMYFSVVLMHK